MQTNFKQSNNYVDYNVVPFFTDYGLGTVSIALRPIKTDKPGFENAVMLHVEGERAQDGQVLKVDFWPRADMTSEELEAIASKTLAKAYLRFGTYVNEETGETIEGQPKFVKAFFTDGTIIDLADGRDARPYLG